MHTKVQGQCHLPACPTGSIKSDFKRRTHFFYSIHIFPANKENIYRSRSSNQQGCSCPCCFDAGHPMLQQGIPHLYSQASNANLHILLHPQKPLASLVMPKLTLQLLLDDEAWLFSNLISTLCQTGAYPSCPRCPQDQSCCPREAEGWKCAGRCQTHSWRGQLQS